MAVSDKDDPKYGSGDHWGRVSRYDFVLTVIPVAFLLAGVASQVLSVPPRTLLATAALVGTIVLFDALFVNPPGT